MGYDQHSLLADPMDDIFVDWESGNYELLPNSQAVDSGTSDVSYIVTYDINGVSRPFGNGYDIGAYEYNPSGADIPGKTEKNPCKIVIRENEILFESLEPNQIIEIFDIKGVLIHKSDLIPVTTYRYNIGNLPSGIYFWHVKGSQRDKSKGKIVIAR